MGEKVKKNNGIEVSRHELIVLHGMTEKKLSSEGLSRAQSRSVNSLERKGMIEPVDLPKGRFYKPTRYGFDTVERWTG